MADQAPGWGGDWNEDRRQDRRDDRYPPRAPYNKGQGKGFNAAHNPQNFAVPWFLQKLGARGHENSCLFIDNRDNRMVSPFQGFSPLEIAENSNSSINVLVERGLMRKPNAGFYINFFSIITLQMFRVTVCISVDTAQGCVCANWDQATFRALDHEAFRPFQWPDMFESTPTVVDIKLKVDGVLLQHVMLTAYRSDNDCTVTKNWWADDVVNAINPATARMSITVAVFQGYRVSCVTVEPGGRLYAASANGAVLALDKARCHFELRKVVRNSADALKSDTDKIEFRYLDAVNRIEVAAGRCSCPNTWLIGAHISGGQFATIIKAIRDQGGQIESPDHALQLSQLAAMHDSWFNGSTKQESDEGDPPALKTLIPVPSNPANVHIVWDAQLEFKGADVVAAEALAIAGHDPTVQAPAIFLPPSDGVGAQVIAAPEGANNPVLAVDLPPLMVQQARAQQAIFQPDQARGVEQLQALPATVDLTANVPAVVEDVPVLELTIEQRRAQARPKARAPAIPQAIIQAAIRDPTQLSVGSVPRTRDQRTRAIDSSSALERELAEQLSRENDARQTLAVWAESQDQGAVGVREAHIMISRHDIKISGLINQLMEMRGSVQHQIPPVGTSSSSQAPRSGPIEYSPPLIEEVTDLGETF